MAKNQPSTIDRLPKEVRELIGSLRQDGRTIDEILGKLKELQLEVSRSALGRHVKSLDVVGERMRRSRAMATALVDRFGDEPDHKLTRLNIEMMQGAVFQILIAAAEAGDQGGNAEGGDPVTLSPQDVGLMAKALGDLTRAAKIDTDRLMKVQAEAREQMAKEAAKAVDQVAKRQGAGLTRETIEAIKAEILGIRT